MVSTSKARERNKFTVKRDKACQASQAMILLNIIIATYNRPSMLAALLDSIAEASMPADLCLQIIVADNNSTGSNREANKACTARHPELDIIYLFEPRQGKSWALNSAIEKCTAEYVGFIDDDEKLDAMWLETAAVYLRASTVDYLGGPYKPDWASEPPHWLPAKVGKYPAVLGWIEQTDTVQPFDDFGGTLCGGNCIVRRCALIQVGGFSTQVGRFANNLMCGEDDELHRRLREIGKFGIYDPALIIFHHIPAERMTRKYHLRWGFWSGVSNGVRLSWLPEEPASKLFSIARYRYGAGLRGVARWLCSLTSRQESAKANGFSGLMDAFYLAGMLYGRHFFRPNQPATEGIEPVAQHSRLNDERL